jgi:hypothetical protein
LWKTTARVDSLPDGVSALISDTSGTRVVVIGACSFNEGREPTQTCLSDAPRRASVSMNK